MGDGRRTASGGAVAAVLIGLAGLTGLAVLGGCGPGPTVEPEPDAAVAPPQLGAEAEAAVAEAIEGAIEAGDIPGAVLLVGVGEHTVHREAYGRRAVEPEPEAMTAETIFDLASLTKPLATATSIMILADRGQLDLDEPVATYLPQFAAAGKAQITVADLLLHRGGLAPANPLSDFDEGPAAGLARIFERGPRNEPGSGFTYTDLGYIVLARVVEAVYGQPLDAFAREEIYQPLGMSETTFNPPADWRDRIAPTERRDGDWMRGQVHDPRAWRLGGVAGHAGLFGTADDLARYCRMILNGGQYAGRRILSEAAVRQMTAVHWLGEDGESDGRSYAFDVATGYSSPRGGLPVGQSFGHTGFTGTSLWIDRESGVFIILLTNRVHPDGDGRVVGLRRELATIIANALLGPENASEEATAAAAAPGAEE